mgnify:CR=1
MGLFTEIEYVLYCETDGEVLRGLDAIIRAARRSTNVFFIFKVDTHFAYVVPFLFLFSPFIQPKAHKHSPIF